MSDSHQGRSSGIIPGLVKGLATTARSVTRRHHTVEYPDVKPKLPPRTRGVIALTEENCTSCMLCARECPDWCIYIDSHKEELPATTPGGRTRQRNVLDRFAIDFSLCMYCGICVEVCPFDALHWSPEFEYSELDIRELLHEKDRLGEWMATVPPPPALDPGSPEPAEVVAINRPPRVPAAAGAAGAGAAAAANRPARADRPERPARAERPERPAGAERPERPARTERPERPAGAARPERPARAEGPEGPAPADLPSPPEGAGAADQGEATPAAAAAEDPARPERLERIEDPVPTAELPTQRPEGEDS